MGLSKRDAVRRNRPQILSNRPPWGILRRVTTFVARLTTVVVVLGAVVGFSVSPSLASDATSTTQLLGELGFSLTDPGPSKGISFTKKGLLVPMPWGDYMATIVSTPVDRMVRVPISPNTDPGQQRFQPYVTAGTRKNVDSDPILEQSRASSFADSGKTPLKAGAGILFKLDTNVELFGEYQFMRLQRETEGRGALGGPLGTTLDTSGFSLGLSVRY
jgi:hypothetical protein